jgi:glycosyltransferase involved in cell wall biosynthesis
MACPIEDFAELVANLYRSDGASEWHLVCFYPPPIPLPENTTASLSTRSFRVALGLWVTAMRGRYAAAIVCCRSLDQPAALQSLVEFVSVLRVQKRMVVDRAGRSEQISPASLRSAAGLAAVPPLLWLSTIVTRLGLRFWRRDHARRPAFGGRTAILVPILPDLSHTFVYREALELKRRNPEYEIVALERGDPSIVHREARELLVHARFPPRVSTAHYLAIYLSHWARRPSAMAATVRAIRPHTASFGEGWIANDMFCFLRLEHLQHSNYVMLGLVLADFLERSGVGYVHVYGSTYPAVRMFVAHLVLRIPFSVSTFVDFDYTTPFHMLSEKFGAARFVVTCTAYCANRLAARVPEISSKVRVLRHALPPALHPQNLRPVDGHSRIVYIGRFVPKKGLDTVIRATAFLRARHVPFTAHLYGAGPDEATLRSLVASLALERVVHFEGPIPNELFYTVLNEDDVVVCASRYMPDGERDGIPVTLIEAMAAGVTVVSTTVSGIPELVADGVNGFLVDPDRPEELARVLQLLIEQPERRAAVRLAAIETVERHFSLQTAVDQLDRWISRENGSADGAARPASARVGEPV